jgi:hypothetical protein
MNEKSQIYYNVWCCAYRRRYEAQIKKDWKRYHGEHQTLLMCLKIAKWTTFDSEKPKHLN